jgi:biopolymer transport protein ExbD
MIDARARPSASIPTSSVADIAFLLLVFFLVTTVFPKDNGLALVLPEGRADVAPGNVLHLLVRPTGEVEVRFGDAPRSRVVRAEDVGGIWHQSVVANPNLIAAVKTYPDAAYGRMVDVLDQLQSVGARRISLQAMPATPR